jgi:hypothetical protein
MVLRIPEGLWQSVVIAARRRREAPDGPARRALRDFLSRLADAELPAGSAAEARRSGRTVREVDRLVRRRREGLRDGRSKTSASRRP